MYVCLCNNLKCRDFEAASKAGAQTAMDAFKALGVRPKCGACVCFAEDHIKKNNLKINNCNNNELIKSVE